MSVDLLGIGKGLEAFEKLTKEMRVLAEAYFKPQVEERGMAKADKIRVRRLENLNQMLRKSKKLLKNRSIKPGPLNLKLGVPLLEYASLEEDDNLQSKWAGLLASSLVGDQVLASFPKILSELTPVEACLLDALFKAHAYREPESDPSVFATATSADVRQMLGLKEGTFRVLAENLCRLGLLESVTASPRFWSDTDNIQHPTFMEIRLTALGFEFVKACEGPQAQKRKRK